MATTVADLAVQVNGDISGLQRGLQNANRGIEGFARNAAARLDRLGSSLTGLGAGMTALTAPIAAFGIAGIKAASDFQGVMTELSARTGTVGADLDAMAQFAQEMGAQTVFSATDAAQAMLELTSSGQTAAEAMETLPEVLNLAAAGGLELGHSADTVTDIMAQFQLSVADAETVTNALARAASSSSADVNTLAEGFANVGPIANQFGLSVDDTAAILATFAENGIKGAEAGTQLRSMLLNMSRNTSAVESAWADLDTSLYDSEGNVRDLNAVLDDMGAALATMPVQEQNRIMQDLAGTYGLSGLNALLAAGGFDTMQASMDAQTSAADVAAARMDTFGQKINSLKGSVETLMITALTPFMENVLTPMADRLINITNRVTEWAEANPELTSTIVKVLAGAVILGPVLIAVGAAMSALAPIVAALGAAFALLTGPVGIAIGLAGALAFAYAKNIGGFADLVNAQIPKLQAAWATVVGVLSTARDKIATHMENVKAAYETGGIGGALQVGLVKPIQGLGPLLVEQFNALNTLIRTKINTVKTVFSESGLSGVVDTFIIQPLGLTGAATFIVGQFNALKGKIAAKLDEVKGVFAAGGFGAVLKEYLNIDVNVIGENIMNALSGENIGRFVQAGLTAALQGAVNFGALLLNMMASGLENFAAGDMDWSGFGSKVWAALLGGIKTGVDLAQWIGAAIIRPLFNAVMALDFTQFADAATRFGTAILDILALGLGTLGEWVQTNLIDPIINKITDLAPALEDPLTAATDFMVEKFGAVKTIIDEIIMAIDGMIGRLQIVGQMPGMASDIAGAATENNMWGQLPGIAWGAIRQEWGGGKAVGGPVMSGTTYLVGEQGPELFTPSRSGSIVPNDALGGGGGAVYNITAYGANAGDVFDLVRRTASQRSPG